MYTKSSSSPAIGVDGTVYVGSPDHNLYAVSPEGTTKWAVATGDSIVESSPALGVDAVFLATPHSITETGQGVAAVQLAAAAGVKRVVLLSMAMPSGATRIPHVASKAPIEHALITSRVDYTILSDKLRGPEKAQKGILHPNQTGVKYWEWYMAA